MKDSDDDLEPAENGDVVGSGDGEVGVESAEGRRELRVRHRREDAPQLAPLSVSVRNHRLSLQHSQVLF